jgi:hypothetical protein|eukprot:COSAG06_NODE_3109_length_5845_cov_5.988688_4_plen_38_part_00
MDQLIGVTSVQSCGALCFGNPDCVAFRYGQSSFVQVR